MKRRLWSAMLAAAMLLTMLPTTVWAAEAQPENELTYVTVGEEENAQFNELLEDRLKLMVTYGDLLGDLLSTGDNMAGKRLTGNALKAYTTARDAIIGADGIAAKGGSTNFTLEGVTLSEADADAAFTALCYDYPYEMYWRGLSYSYGTNTFKISVSADYREGTETYKVNATKAQAATEKIKTASGKALEVLGGIPENATPIETLTYFKDEICKLVDYNYDALGEDVAYGNPWQLIYVFDGVDSTKVVCEGYAKAFQYLCDVTFGADSSSKVQCYTVSGQMNGGNHMWNIVTLDGNSYYLVDVTNCDEDSVGSPNWLFMVGQSGGSVSKGYSLYIPRIVTLTNTGVTRRKDVTYSYTYKDETVNAWPEKVLTLAGTDYAGTPYIRYSAEPTALTVGDTVNLTATMKNVDSTGYTFAIISSFTHLVPAGISVNPTTGAVTGQVTTASEEAKNLYIQATKEGAEPIYTYVTLPAVTEKVIEPSVATKIDLLAPDQIFQLECAPNDTREIIATVVDQYGNDILDAEVTWTSADPSIASVSASKGAKVTVTAGKAGKTTITVTSGGAKFELPVIVNEPAHVHQYGTTWETNNTHHWLVCTTCGAVKDRAEHKWDEGKETKAPTCAEEGVKTFTCTICGATKTEKIATVEHKWDEGKETKPPTCTQKGVKTFTCTVCQQTKTEEIAALGHDWSKDWSSDETQHWHKCTRCDAADAKVNHDWDKATVKVDKEATCTEDGSKTLTCVCGKTKTEAIPATGHKPGTWVNTDAAKHWRVCETCKTELDEADHQLNTVITTAPTYDAAGVKTTTCATCGYATTAEVPKLEHTYDNVWSKDDSKHWHACIDAGFETLKADEASHELGTPVVTKAATYEAAGQQVSTCTVCGYQKVETIDQLTHTYAETWSHDEFTHWHACADDGFESLKKDEAAHEWGTGTESGSTITYTCVCGETKTETVDTSDHTDHTGFDAKQWKSDADTHWNECSDFTVHTDTTAPVKANENPHTWDAGKVTTPATASSKGEKTYTCTVCQYEKKVEIPQHTLSTAWTWDDDNHWHACTESGCTEQGEKAAHTWEVTSSTAATTSAAGLETSECSICHAVKQKVLPQLSEHTYSTTWDKDNDFHWHKCTVEDHEDVKDKAAHTWNEGEVTTRPTLEATGVKTFTCTVCSQTRTETLAKLDPYHEHVWASAWSKNTTHHWHECTASGCGITANSEKDGYAVHTFGSWVVDTAATATTPGSQHRNCTVCDYRENSTIPATGSGGSSSGGSSGGGSGSSSSSVTVPVSGDKTTVRVSATVSGSTATVSKIDASKLENGSQVEIDFTGLGRNITSAQLPASAINDLLDAKRVEGLTIKLPAGEAAFDASALEAIQDQAGSQITVTVAQARSSDLNARQREAVGSSPVFDLTVKSGSKVITDFRGGYATVSVPYTLPAGHDPAKVVVYYLDNSGNITPCETMYDVRSKTVVFTTSHFSKYFISSAAEDWKNPFVDVASNAYYLNAVRWALENNVTSGTGANTFSPDAVCNRAQMVTFLWRAAGSPAPSSMTTAFTDIQPSDYFYTAVLWAAEKGVTSGTSATTFSPNSKVTRAQAVAILYQYAGAPASASASHFLDVPANAYYAKAVAWAAEKGVTSGTSATTFSPDAQCSRAQIVTFLYQALKA